MLTSGAVHKTKLTWFTLSCPLGQNLVLAS